MAGVLVFDQSNGPVRYLIRAKEKVVAFEIYLFETNTKEEVKVIQCRDFEVFIGFFNCCYLRTRGEVFLICPRMSCDEWNLVVVGNGWVRVNQMIHHFQVFIRDENVRLCIGDSYLKALVRLNDSKGMESQEIPINLENQEKNLEVNKCLQHGFIGSLKPIRSLQELLLWQPDDQSNVSRIPCQPLKKSACRELLVCHDFGGNYKQDVTITSIDSSFKFFHFLHTDIFVYFSHSRVTIPPVAWIESAHKQGTLMLGTFITEGEDGEKENLKLCENLNLYVEVLVKVMDHYGFDGYLINIEAFCENPEKMIEFLQTLTLTAKSVNSLSRIIWYDSMDTEGKIRWKSCLNSENLEFLQVSDGFFTDYHWKKGMPEGSAAVAGEDNWKVYTGTDVFGRGTWGGGGFDTKIGVEDSLCTSCAIFAPGWTMEHIASDFQSFFNAEKMMWAERANPLVDFGGKVFKDRQGVNKINALVNWECFISKDFEVEESYDWVKVSNSDKYWEVTDELEFVSSFVKSKRQVTVNFLNEGIGFVNHVVGKVEVKGTPPKVDDRFWVQIVGRTRDGRSFQKVERGVTGMDWKTVKLEIKEEGIQEITWTEGGFDSEYWQGFYGSRFRKTSVVYKQQGPCILDNFQQKIWTHPFCTWFSLGQGKKLYSRGKSIFNSTWNSLNDFDILPSLTVLKDFEFDFETIYHGTNSLKLPLGCFSLFKCDFETKDLNIKVVYKGNMKLVMENLELVMIQNDGEWKIDYYAINGHVDELLVETLENTFLAGIHLFQKIPDFQLTGFQYKIVWNLKSLESEFPLFDLQGNFEELPRFIRFLDIFVNEQFVTRAYRSKFRICELPAKGQEVRVLFVAEDLKGDEASRFVLNLGLDEIQKTNPLV